MLEGKELEGPIADVGGYSLDLDTKGMLKIEAHAEKKVDEASFKVTVATSVEVNVLDVLVLLAEKTKNTQIDDMIAKKIKDAVALLG